MFATGLACRQCGKAVDMSPRYYCEDCFGPLEVRYDYDAIRESGVARPDRSTEPHSIWRYRALLPVEGMPIDLGTGWTPLLKVDRLGRELGLRDLWVKNDSVNPTFSFKDRNVAVAVNNALGLGFDTFACASTDNLAGSVAGFAARAGLRSYVFVPSDLERNKLLSAAVYGTTLVTIDGNYDAANTRLIGAQPEGCNPVVRAFKDGTEDVAPVAPNTIAQSLAIGDPADGYYALRAIRATGGPAGNATDAEIVEGIRLLARTEGIFTEPAGGTVIAVARKLRQQGQIDPEERIVLCITGNGLKTPEALDGSHFTSVHLQRASLSEFESALETREAIESPVNQALQSV